MKIGTVKSTRYLGAQIKRCPPCFLHFSFSFGTMDEVEAILYLKADIKFYLTFYMFVPSWKKFGKGNVHINLLSNSEFHGNRRSEKVILYLGGVKFYPYFLHVGGTRRRNWSRVRFPMVWLEFFIDVMNTKCVSFLCNFCLKYFTFSEEFSEIWSRILILIFT